MLKFCECSGFVKHVQKNATAQTMARLLDDKSFKSLSLNILTRGKYWRQKNSFVLMENPSSLGYSVHCFSTLAVPCHLSWHLQEQCQRKNRNAQFQSSLHKVLKKAVILHCRKDKIKRIQKVSITGNAQLYSALDCIAKHPSGKLPRARGILLERHLIELDH